MNKFQKCGLLTLCISSAMPVSAMQALEESDLSKATAQDGVNIGLYFPNGNIAYDTIALIDKDGISGSTTHSNPASIVIASDLTASERGVSLQKADGSASVGGIHVAIDSDGNSGEPVANINISMPVDAPLIHINPMSVYLSPGADGLYQSGVVKSTATKILSIGNKGLDILFKSNDTLGMNVQFGNSTQGHMFKVTSGSLVCIANNAMCVTGSADDGSDPIRIYDKSGSSISFGFKLSAANQSTGVRLYEHTDNGGFGGVYGDIVNSGLIFGAEGKMDKFDLTLSNVTMGEAGVQGASTFDNFKNGSIGNIGMKGVAITDFKTTVRGL